MAQAKQDAEDWTLKKPGRKWATVTPTHSMEPFVNENCIVLLEPYTGQPFPNRQTICFDRGDTVNVLHVAVDQTADSVYVSGYNNHDSDGWFPKNKIAYLEVGIFFTDGKK